MKKALVTCHLGRHFTKFGHYDMEVLLNMGYEVHIAANFKGKLDSYENHRVITHQVDFDRKPFKLSNIKAYSQIKKIINNYKFDIIQTQSPVGGVITRFAARESRKLNNTGVVYTAHGFHFYDGAPLKNWLLYYLIERFASRYTDTLITINSEDYSRAKTLKAKNVKLIPGVGIDLNNIHSKQKKVNKLKEELGITKEHFVISSIGELNNNKNHKVVLEALYRINNKKIKYIIAGSGKLESSLNQKIKEYNLENQVKLLGYRDETLEIVELSDIFIFPSYREGLSLSLMEAMALGKPVIASNIRGNNDLIDDNKGGFLFNPQDVCQLSYHLEEMLNNSDLRDSLSKYNIEKIKEYSLEKVQDEMISIYYEIK